MESFRVVRSLTPLAPYLGGKRNLSARLVELIEATPHQCYAEPFVGMGGVFLRRQRVPKAEVINDYSRDVATFFRVLQRHYVAFLELMKFQLTSRAEFERLVATNPDTLTDLERAARFLYLQRTAFGGKIVGRNFGVCTDRGARFDITRLGPLMEEIHSRLSGVTIECLPYAAFIGRYDRPGTLFYLDPPYFGCEGDYGAALFGRDDFEQLAAVLRGVKGRFILSINDAPEVREIFAGIKRVSVKTTYTVAGGANAKAVRELIFTGGAGGAKA